MNIVVRVPRDQVPHFWEEPPADATHEYWRLPIRPRNCRRGDTIFFAITDRIVAYATICAITREDSEWRAYWQKNDFNEISEVLCPISLPTRGFTYIAKSQFALAQHSPDDIGDEDEL